MTQEIPANVGARLRNFRERNGWSLRMLSERCGLSINAISRIERGENSPTVSSLQRLAVALSIPITDFFAENPGKAADFHKSGTSPRVQSSCYEVEHRGRRTPRMELEPLLFEIEPGCDQSSRPVNHKGYEFIYCLEGEVEYCINDQVYTLTCGDSLLFAGHLPHYWRNRGTETARLLFVFQSPRDTSQAFPLLLQQMQSQDGASVDASTDSH